MLKTVKLKNPEAFASSSEANKAITEHLKQLTNGSYIFTVDMNTREGYITEAMYGANKLTAVQLGLNYLFSETEKQDTLEPMGFTTTEPYAIASATNAVVFSNNISKELLDFILEVAGFNSVLDAAYQMNRRNFLKQEITKFQKELETITKGK